MTQMAAIPTTSHHPPSRSVHRWWALAVLALAQFLVVLDASIVNIALPSLGRDLSLDAAALSWTITAYVLPFGGLLLLGGRLADRYGHRRLFLIGAAGFVVASALAGLSSDGTVLLAARALQGASAALLAPASLALVTQLFPLPADRIKALGAWGAVAGLGSAAGVLLGGVLTANFGWSAVFFVNVPVGIVVLVAVPLLITTDPRPQLRPRLDVWGAASITTGLAMLVGAFSAADRLGLTSPITVLLLVGGVALIALFVVIERRSASPLVPLGIFRRRAVSAGNLAMLLLGAAMTGLFFILSVFMQEVLHYDALTAGLTQLPLAGVLVLVAGVVPTVIGRLGLRRTLVGALLVLAAGLFWLARTPSDALFVVDLLGPSLLIGGGLGAAFVASTQLAVQQVDADEAGLAAGLVNTSQQIGGALGIAVLASLAATRTATLRLQDLPPADALTGGYSWAFLGAAALAVSAAAAVVVVSDRTGRPAAARRPARSSV